MFEIETKNLKISDELNRKIEMIRRFACVKYEFISGILRVLKIPIFLISPPKRYP